MAVLHHIILVEVLIMSKRKAPNAQERLELFASKHWGKRQQYANTVADTGKAIASATRQFTENNKGSLALAGGAFLGLEIVEDVSEAATAMSEAEIAQTQTFAEAMANRR
jgi:hypothetical protein